MKTVRTFIVDDHAGFRSVLKKVLERSPAIEVVGEAESGEETLERFGRVSPNLVTVDVNLPGMDGFELTRRLKTLAPIPTVIIISINGNPAFHREAAKLNCAYIAKESLFQDLPRVLNAVIGGENGPAIN